MQRDRRSTFYESEGCTFSLTKLNHSVSEVLKSSCQLVKLAEGTWHKVYDVFLPGNDPSGVVVRVACPAFPRDKMESEVATIRYIAEHTSVPVPKIYAWNSDASNVVGAEYMIMEKVTGCPALDIWDNLAWEVKERVVAQVARDLISIFELRFTMAGSLYLSSDPQYVVGSIVDPKYFKTIDGKPVYTDRRVQQSLHQFRGPFSNAADWLSSSIKAEIFALSSTPSPFPPRVGDHLPRDLLLTMKIMNQAVSLCLMYPGNHPVINNKKVFEAPFSFMLDDFSLSNIMLDDAGHITGYIDFEVATIVPLWKCATLPEWLQVEDHNDGWSEDGGSEHDKQLLRAIFFKEMDDHITGRDWREAYEKGLPFRDFSRKLASSASFWEYDGDWVEEQFEWAAKHPGVGCPAD